VFSFLSNKPMTYAKCFLHVRVRVCVVLSHNVCVLYNVYVLYSVCIISLYIGPFCTFFFSDSIYNLIINMVSELLSVISQ
jgi:hypothetical protein